MFVLSIRAGCERKKKPSSAQKCWGGACLWFPKLFSLLFTLCSPRQLKIEWGRFREIFITVINNEPVRPFLFLWTAKGSQRHSVNDYLMNLYMLIAVCLPPFLGAWKWIFEWRPPASTYSNSKDCLRLMCATYATSPPLQIQFMTTTSALLVNILCQECENSYAAKFLAVWFWQMN